MFLVLNVSFKLSESESKFKNSFICFFSFLFGAFFLGFFDVFLMDLFDSFFVLIKSINSLFF
jgi:hypothetical protein